MSGYGGSPDLESEHALIMSENGIELSQSMLVGRILTECLDCGEEIDPRRVEYARKTNMKCEWCVKCQESHDKAPSVRMLTKML